jgi:hypothetical protein
VSVFLEIDAIPHFVFAFYLSQTFVSYVRSKLKLFGFVDTVFSKILHEHLRPNFNVYGYEYLVGVEEFCLFHCDALHFHRVQE